MPGQVTRYMDERYTSEAPRCDVDVAKPQPCGDALMPPGSPGRASAAAPMVVSTPSTQPVDCVTMDSTPAAPTADMAVVASPSMTDVTGSAVPSLSAAPACTAVPGPAVTNGGTTSQSKRQRLFLDETLPSFFRRLAWTPDGSLLLCPSGVLLSPESSGVPTATNVTHVFARDAWSRFVLACAARTIVDEPRAGCSCCCCC